MHHDVQPLFILFGLAVVGVIAFVGWYNSAYQRSLRAILSVAPVRVADAKDGQIVRIVGTLKLLGEPLHAPLSQRPCAHFDVQVDHHVKRGKHSRWVPLFRDVASTDFLLEDESGRAIVSTGHLVGAIVLDHHQRSGTLNDPTPELEALLARHGQESTGLLGFNKSLRYNEGVLEVGERVVVVGRARWEDDPTEGASEAARGGYRSAPRRKRLVIEAHAEPVHVSDDPTAVR